MPFSIRPYHPSDLPSLYRICLLTGDAGADASHLYGDPELLGHYYVGPYAIAEPDLAFVLTLDGRPIGYIVGTRDTAAFGRWCETEWFPPLRERYPLPSASFQNEAEQWMIRSIHRGHETVNHWPAYPAHLHVDILPEGQGQGMGGRLMVHLWEQLKHLAVPGVHLGVGNGNARAIRFYEHLGFEKLEIDDWGYIFGKKL